MAQPAREDAIRNQRRLLLAARDAVAAAGPGVSVREIADLAGVGVTTLYRHFDGKNALIDAVSVNRWATMTRLARARSAADAPLHAVIALIETFTRMVTADDAFIAATGLRVGRTPIDILPVKAQFEPQLAQLWSSAQRRQLIRSHADARDAMEFAGMIRDPERRSPMLITLLNGICTDAVDVEQLVAARVKPRPAPALA
jgi:AcrR family transcriptional regulator